MVRKVNKMTGIKFERTSFAGSKSATYGLRDFGNGSEPKADAIAERAWQIWCELGQPEGRELDHWLAAERELRAGLV